MQSEQLCSANKQQAMFHELLVGKTGRLETQILTSVILSLIPKSRNERVSRVILQFKNP